MRRVVVTGAGGFLGQGIRNALQGEYQLRLVDIDPFEDPHNDVMIGDVADLDAARRMVKGMDVLVIAHMACRTEDRSVYDEPPLAFDANVKGTANLCFAALEEGVKRAVLISSVHTVLKGYDDPSLPLLGHHLAPIHDGNLYTLSKICQEQIVSSYHQNGLEVAILRVGGIIDHAQMKNKYGDEIRKRSFLLIDRTDIGTAVAKAIALQELQCDTFYILGTKEAKDVFDMNHTYDTLKWKPRFDFSELPTAT